MSPLYLLLLPLVAAAPLPQWSNSFFGPDSQPLSRAALGAPSHNPYTQPTYPSPPGYGPAAPAYAGYDAQYYGAPPPPPAPPTYGVQGYGASFHDAHLTPSFTAPGHAAYNPHTLPHLTPALAPLPDKASLHPHKQPAAPAAPPPPPPPPPAIDLMSAPKSLLPGAPAAEDAQYTFEKSVEEPAPAAPAPAPARKPIQPLGGIAGTGTFLDAAKHEHVKHPERRPGSRPDRPDRGRNDMSMMDDAAEQKPTEQEEQEEEEAPPPKPVLPDVQVVPAADGSPRYKVNIGGLDQGAAGRKPAHAEDEGPSSYNVWTDENVRELKGNDCNPEAERYIRERLLPKMRPEGRKKGRKQAGGAGGVFNVFGGKD